MMRMPDPSSDDAAARLDNANPKLHQTVDERQISGKNNFKVRFTYLNSQIRPWLGLREWKEA